MPQQVGWVLNKTLNVNNLKQTLIVRGKEKGITTSFMKFEKKLNWGARRSAPVTEKFFLRGDGCE